jgi:hypothetical protein
MRSRENTRSKRCKLAVGAQCIACSHGPSGSGAPQHASSQCSAGQVTDSEAAIRQLRARVQELQAAADEAPREAARASSCGQSFLASLFNKQQHGNAVSGRLD